MWLCCRLSGRLPWHYHPYASRSCSRLACSRHPLRFAHKSRTELRWPNPELSTNLPKRTTGLTGSATDTFRNRPFHFVAQSVVPGSGVGGGGYYGTDINNNDQPGWISRESSPFGSSRSRRRSLPSSGPILVGAISKGISLLKCLRATNKCPPCRSTGSDRTRRSTIRFGLASVTRAPGSWYRTRCSPGSC